MPPGGAAGRCRRVGAAGWGPGAGLHNRVHAPPGGDRYAACLGDRARLQRGRQRRALAPRADRGARDARHFFRGPVHRRWQPGWQHRAPRPARVARRTRAHRQLSPQLRPDRRGPGRASTTAVATSSCSWTATCRTTRTTSRTLLEKIDEGYDVVSGWRRDRQDDASRGAPAPRIANWLIARVTGGPVARLRLHAQGLPARGDPGRAAVRRDAPVHPRLRIDGRRSHHRAAGQSPAARPTASRSTRCRARRG